MGIYDAVWCGKCQIMLDERVDDIEYHRNPSHEPIHVSSVSAPQCPKCGSTKIADCKGGTQLVGSDPKINYICTECCNEF